jgi:hypothetical protein
MFRTISSIEGDMRLLDDDRDVEVENATLFVTAAEAEEMMSHLARLIELGGVAHSHISTEDFQRELTVCLYEEGGENSELNQRSLRLLAGLG